MKLSRKIRFLFTRKRVVLLLDALPIILPAMIAAFGMVAIVLLLLNQLHSVLVWPVGTVAAISAAWLVMRYYVVHGPGTAKERVIGNAVAVLGVTVWVSFNILFTAQHMITNRDPGVYAVTAHWITKQEHLQLPATKVFGTDNTDIRANSGGFSGVVGNEEQVAAQGAHLLPTLLGLAGRVVGDVHMLRLNVLFGGLALLAVYAFARQFVRPQWALVAISALSLTLPFMYFSRDTYTEPLAATLIFGSLALAGLAWRTNQARLWLLAGLVAGASTLTRIDAFLVVAGLCAFAVIQTALAAQPERKHVTKNMALLVAGMGITSMIGLLDIMQLSSSYFLSEWVNIKPELILIIAILGVGILGTIVCWKTRLLQILHAVTRRWRAFVASASVIIVAALLIFRPNWYTAYAEDGMRTYAEFTTHWLAWYLGPVLAIAGGVGFAYVVWRVVKNNGVLLAAVLVIGGTALLYLIKPSIMPDQVWASRRFLPVVMPGLAVFAVMLLQRLYDLSRVGKLAVPGKATATVIATLLVVGPLTVSLPFFYTREYVTYPLVESVCRNVSADAAILWVGMAGTQLVEPTKAMCGIPAAGYGPLFRADYGPSQIELAEAAKAAIAEGYRPLIGVYAQDKNIVGGDIPSVYDYSYALVEKTYESPPKQTYKFKDSLLLGEIKPDGTIISIR